jgi:ribosome biogenesis GTPase
MYKGRIIEEHKTKYMVSLDKEIVTATVRGSFFETDIFPKVGDYVMCEQASDGKVVIEEILPRTSSVSRKAVETEAVQIIVANVDIIFIVIGLDNDFNMSRLERYLLLATQSNITPVVILNKSDVVTNIEEYIGKVTTVSSGVAVHAVSAITGEGMDAFLGHMNNETTAVLLGSSGAGKSTITNWLLGDDVQGVGEVRGDDSRGRHTTTARQLFTLPQGGYLIDTPGMRELGAVDTSVEDEQEIFNAIDQFSNQCKFSDCDHEKSEGCAVLVAIENGDISQRQFSNYHKIKRERLFQAAKHNEESSREHKQKQKKLHQKYAKINKRKTFEKDL